MKSNKSSIVALCMALIVLLVASCAGPTKLTYQELPKDKPLAVTKDNVTLRLVSFGYTDDWSELEIAIANGTNETLDFDASKIYLTNAQGYDLIPLKSFEIEERLKRKTGKWVNPLTVGALAAVVGAIVAPGAVDRTNFGRAAVVLGAAGVGSEMAKRQSADEDVKHKEDVLLKNYKIPPGLHLGGVLYYRSTDGIKGVKAFIKINGKDELFSINLD